MAESLSASEASVKRAVVVGVVLLLWAGYTALQTLFVIGAFGDMASALLGFIPGILGLGLLLAAGLSRQQCYLVVHPFSWSGFAVLAAVFFFALAAILPVSVWQGWSWRAALVYAPASGISQELFFRSVLLPTMQRVLKGRPGWALILHSVLFGLWHIGPLFVGAPLWAVILVMFVPFLSGLGWGWQVTRDRTVLWAMIQHSLIWVIALQFAQPG